MVDNSKVLDVPCPKCKAHKGERCRPRRTPDGTRTAPHSERASFYMASSKLREELK